MTERYCDYFFYLNFKIFLAKPPVCCLKINNVYIIMEPNKWLSLKISFKWQVGEAFQIIIARIIWLSMLFGVKKEDTGTPGDIWLHLENQQQPGMSLLKKS